MTLSNLNTEKSLVEKAEDKGEIKNKSKSSLLMSQSQVTMALNNNNNKEYYKCRVTEKDVKCVFLQRIAAIDRMSSFSSVSCFS